MRWVGFNLLLSSMACGPLGGPYAVDDDGCADGCETSEATTSTTGGETTGSSSSTTDGSEDGTEGGDTSSFIPTGDAGDPGCDIWDPDACPEGEKCTGVAENGGVWDQHLCVPVMGDKQWLEPCLAFGENPGYTGLDDCAKGLMCVDVGDDDVGHCYEFCTGSPFDPQCLDEGLWNSPSLTDTRFRPPRRPRVDDGVRTRLG